jgi:hypothetical protein
MGRLIPAGTGIEGYRRVGILVQEDQTEEQEESEVAADEASQVTAVSSEAKL